MAPVMDVSPFDLDPNLDVALRVKEASFQWEESVPPKETLEKFKHKSSKKLSKADFEKEFKGIPQEPFSIKSLDLEIPRGQLCAMVGPVGCGKSSILLGK